MAFTLSKNPKILNKYLIFTVFVLHVSFVFVIIFVCVFVFVFVVVPPQLDLHQQAPHRSTDQLAKPSEGLLLHFQRSSLEVEFDQKKTSNQIKIACLGEQGEGGDAQTRLYNFFRLAVLFFASGHASSEIFALGCEN